MELDGALGDKEAFGDGGVLEAPGEQREDFELSWCQGVGPLRVFADAAQQAVGDGGAEERAPSVDGSDGGEDVSPGGALEQLAAGARAQGAEDALVRVVGGEDDGPGGRVCLLQPLQRLHAVHVRHLQVE